LKCSVNPRSTASAAPSANPGKNRWQGPRPSYNGFSWETRYATKGGIGAEVAALQYIPKVTDIEKKRDRLTPAVAAIKDASISLDALLIVDQIYRRCRAAINRN
jgi:hypothetical protein